MLLISSLNLLTSCTTPPDVVVCVDINPAKGWCTKTISGTSFYVDDKSLYEGKTWWAMKHDMILVPTSSWVEIKTFVIKNCKKTKKCNQKISSWERTIEEVDTHVNEKTK